MIVNGPGVFVPAKVCHDLTQVLPISDLRVRYRERLPLYEILVEIASAGLAYEQRTGSAKFRAEVPVQPAGAEPDAPSTCEPTRWTTGQAAHGAGVSTSAIRRAAREGRLPGVNGEHGWTFTPADVAQWVRRRG